MADAGRQPWFSTIHASSGRNTSWPDAVAAVSTPETRPRRATNQRPVTVAVKASAMLPLPMPTRRPQPSRNCHGSDIQTVDSAPPVMTTSASVTTGRMPNRSIRAAANGAVSP